MPQPVHVGTKDEVLDALRSGAADQIIVEGDDELLLYAANTARAQVSARLQKSYLVGAVLAAAALLLGLVGFWYARPLPAPPPPVQVPEPHVQNFSVDPTLIWGIVALAAITSILIIARQAMSSGNKVELSWKVTQHVSGKLVISKTTQRPPGRKKAAAIASP